MFMSKTVICVVYVDGFIFRARQQYMIDNTIKSFKEDGPIYNRENSKGESVSEFLGVDIKTLYDGGFKLYKTGLIRKVLEDTCMENFNGLPTTTKVDEPLGTYANDSEAKRDCPNDNNLLTHS